MSKKNKHRIPAEYLGAFKAGHRPQTREFIDEELSWDLLDKIIRSKYTDKESMDALAYITKFNNEYYKKVGLKEEDALHNTPELRKDCYDRGNAIDRDIVSMKRHERVTIDGGKTYTSDGEAVNLGSIHNKSMNTRPQEDTVIDLIDVNRDVNQYSDSED